jgi:hypothetical protein
VCVGIDSSWRREGACDGRRRRKADAGGIPHGVTSWGTKCASVQATSDKRQATTEERQAALALHVDSINIGAGARIGAVQTLALDGRTAS